MPLPAADRAQAVAHCPLSLVVQHRNPVYTRPCARVRIHNVAAATRVQDGRECVARVHAPPLHTEQLFTDSLQLRAECSLGAQQSFRASVGRRVHVLWCCTALQGIRGEIVRRGNATS